MFFISMQQTHITIFKNIILPKMSLPVVFPGGLKILCLWGPKLKTDSNIGITVINSKRR